MEQPTSVSVPANPASQCGDVEIGKARRAVFRHSLWPVSRASRVHFPSATHTDPSFASFFRVRFGASGSAITFSTTLPFS